MANGQFDCSNGSVRHSKDKIYRHRSSTTGNAIGRELYEDLFTHQTSAAYVDHVERRIVAVDLSGKVQDKKVFDETIVSSEDCQ